MAEVGEDWDEVAKRVGSRSKQECLTKFVQLPIEDELLQCLDAGTGMVVMGMGMGMGIVLVMEMEMVIGEMIAVSQNLVKSKKVFVIFHSRMPRIRSWHRLPF